MLKKDFWYDLPKELIAQEPANPRDSARLMVLSQKDDSIQHRIFRDLPEYLEPGDLLVVNNSKVLPARIVVALSVALYGMFIAIIVPPARKDRLLAALIVVSMVLSWIFARVPLFDGISGGMKIIILTVLVSGVAAVLFPVDKGFAGGERKEEGGSEHA